MAKKFQTLLDEMTPERRARIDAKANRLMEEMALAELREARKLTQEQLAKQLNVKQPSIAKMEHRTDMYLSTLRNFIQAMGGDMEIVAVFPNGRVRITNLSDGDEKPAQPARRRVLSRA